MSRGHHTSTDRIEFPPGIPFFELKSLDDEWPYKGKTNYSFPQDHGYQYRGVAETKVVLRFWIVSLLCAVLSAATLKLRT